jgi:hypothetical protein
VGKFDLSKAGHTQNILAFKIDKRTYEVVYPEYLDNNTTKYICRNFKKRYLFFDNPTPEWSDEETIDVATPSGLTNPILPLRLSQGYDFKTDEILFALGEYNGSSTYLDSATVKLLGLKRDFSTVTVKQADLLTLVKTVVADATRIYGYSHFWGYDGKIAGAIAAYKTSTERSVVATYDGATWAATRCNTYSDGVQEGLEPIWNNNTFIGWLTEAHGKNGLFINPSLTITQLYFYDAYGDTDSFANTPQPLYDMINNKVIWIEWGGSAGVVQKLKVGNPDATYGFGTLTNVTPSGTITDNEGNNINLNTTCKHNGAIFSDSVTNSFQFSCYRGWTAWANGDYRLLKTELGTYNDSAKYSIMATSANDDKLALNATIRCVNLGKKQFAPMPLITTIASLH